MSVVYCPLCNEPISRVDGSCDCGSYEVAEQKRKEAGLTDHDKFRRDEP